MRKTMFLGLFFCCLFICSVAQCELPEELTVLLGRYNLERKDCEILIDYDCVGDYYCEEYDFNCNEEICEKFDEDCISDIVFEIIFSYDSAYRDLFCNGLDRSDCQHKMNEEYIEVVDSCSSEECSTTKINHRIRLERSGSIIIGNVQYDNIARGEEKIPGATKMWVGMLTNDYLSRDYDASEYEYFVLENTKQDEDNTVTSVTEYYFNFLDSDTIEGVYIWLNLYFELSETEFFVGTKTNITSTTTTIPTTSTTSSMPSSTTTTTTGNCPSEQIYGTHSEQTELLRLIRDNILSQTPEGREIIKLYYQLSPAIAKAMEDDEEFKEEMKEMIDGVLPLIGRGNNTRAGA